MKKIKSSLCHAFFAWIILGTAIALINLPLLTEIQNIDTLSGKFFFLWALFGHCFIIAAVPSLLFLIAGCVFSKNVALAIFAVLTFPVALFLYIDIEVFKLYGSHIDGMVVNLILNPATNDSVDLTLGIYLGIAFKILIFALGYAAVIWLVGKKSRASAHEAKHIGLRICLIVLFALSFVSEKFVYAYAFYKGNPSITYTRTVIGPMYMPFSASKLLHKWGIEENKNKMAHSSSNFKNYPLKKIEFSEDAKKYNICIIIIESARAKIESDITPNISAIQRDCVSAKNYFSSGNCTRFGLSGIFYGLYTTHWHDLLDGRIAPVFFDSLRDLGYKIDVFASTDLSFPEFRKTVFVNLKENEIYDKFDGERSSGYRDEVSLDRLLNSISRDKDSPFCKVVFFNSPHFPYYNEPKMRIFDDAPESSDLNLISDGTSGDPEKMRGYYKRYANSLYYVDSLVGKIVDHLKKIGKFDNTILIITGDHGQEFCEYGKGKGHIIHNGCFSKTQCMPIFAAHFPELGKVEIDKIASHYDIPATIFSLIGVKNPPEDYSDGESLLAKSDRKSVVISSWSEAAITDGQTIVNFGFGAHNIALFRIFDMEYKKLKELPANMSKEIREYMRQKKRFNN